MESSALEKSGVIPNIPKYQGSYLIVFRHPEKIVESAKEVSYKISRVLPSIIYDESNLHTAILIVDTNENFSVEKGVLEELSKSVDTSIRELKKPKIDYEGWLYNQNSLIAKGIPNENFFNVVKKLGKSSKERGLEPILTWGAHMTVSRFAEERKPNEVSDVIKLIKETPILGESVPSIIDVGHFIFTPEFDYHTYEQFKID